MPYDFSLARSLSVPRPAPAILMACALLCAGCQAVDYRPPGVERTPRLVAGLAYRPAPAASPRGSTAEPPSLPVFAGDDVWQRVAQRCTLANAEQGRARTDQQRDWLLSNRGFLRTASERAGPYLHFIVERLDERQLPMELALLPMIESAYDPQANSSAAAAGLWQFMPATGRDFNLAQSSVYDARRDVVASSKAAMDYLERLHARFGNDWFLALAAYNAGEGTVARAVEANRRAGLPTDYWHLSLPRETQAYVPRLLALSTLIREPQAYGVQFAPVANAPYFEVVPLEHAVDIPRLAASAGVEEGPLLKLNSAYVSKRTSSGPSQLLVPRSQVQRVQASLSRMLPIAAEPAGAVATVTLPARPTDAAAPVPVETQPLRHPRRSHYRDEPEGLAGGARVVVYASEPPG